MSTTSPGVIGYRTLTPEEIDMMNKIKSVAELVGQVVEEVENFKAMEAGVDRRWVVIAKTDLQKGFMALVRSVAQPTTF